MKKYLALIGLSVLFAHAPLRAESQDFQTQMDIDALALVEAIQLQAQDEPTTPAHQGIGGVIQDALKKLQDLKQQILDQFDTNKNGQIDPGPELDNLKETVKSVVLLLADSNQNGRIDAEDIKALTVFYLKQAEEKAKAKICPAILEAAEKAGDSLKYRPILKHLADDCKS